MYYKIKRYLKKDTIYLSNLEYSIYFGIIIIELIPILTWITILFFDIFFPSFRFNV